MLVPRITCWIRRSSSKLNLTTRQLALPTMGTGGLNCKGQARAAPKCPYLPVGHSIVWTAWMVYDLPEILHALRSILL